MIGPAGALTSMRKQPLGIHTKGISKPVATTARSTEQLCGREVLFPHRD
jgi:hypothetical protein